MRDFALKMNTHKDFTYKSTAMKAYRKRLEGESLLNDDASSVMRSLAKNNDQQEKN